jgi:CelD/BcsL family acetyltransferase involved in cellulose biosynthesis
MNEMHSAIVAAYRRQPVKPTPDPCMQSPSEALSRGRIAIYSDLADVEGIWRDFERSAACTVFQNFDYLASWLRHIGTNERIAPAIVVIEHPIGDVQAILPLAIYGQGFVRRLSWIGQDLCDYLAPLLTPEFARLEPHRFRALWREIDKLMQSDFRFRHDWVELRKMPSRIESFANPFAVLPNTSHPSPGHIAILSDNWESYYRNRRTAKARKQDRSKLARLSELGDVRLYEPVDSQDIKQTLETLFAQKADGLHRKGIPDLFDRPGYREFFLDIARNTRLHNIVHVSALTVGSALAAINLGLEYKGRYSLLLISYDRSFARLSPGVIHLNKLLERAINRDLTEFDFLVGEQRLKLEWADKDVELYDHISASTMRGMVPAFSRRLLTRTKRVVKQTPWLWSAFQSLRSGARLLYDERNSK